ncbi:MAG: hypothetical protein JOY59_04990 [Candidatus Eremiobacteraeota bacterium]|nr:hypothetical protein [Candidatus Eremiobacteraeota bacterium]
METAPKAPKDVESAFSRSWELLTSNWVIIVPGLIIGFVVGAINYLLLPQTEGYSVGGALTAFSAGVVSVLVNVVGAILSMCYMVGMAGAAWDRGKTTFADGSLAFQRDAGNALTALIGMVVAGVIAAVLALPTLLISILLWFYFFVYTFPAAIVGERPGFAALIDSFRIASRRVGPTLILVVLTCVIFAIGAVIAGILRFVPFLGPIVGAMISQAVLAYVTLVVVGEYLALRDVAAVPPAGVPPSA